MSFSKNELISSLQYRLREIEPVKDISRRGMTRLQPQGSSLDISVDIAKNHNDLPAIPVVEMQSGTAVAANHRQC
jgi:hypothetical protein